MSCRAAGLAGSVERTKLPSWGVPPVTCSASASGCGSAGALPRSMLLTSSVSGGVPGGRSFSSTTTPGVAGPWKAPRLVSTWIGVVARAATSLVSCRRPAEFMTMTLSAEDG